jgi:hypothetical protein
MGPYSVFKGLVKSKNYNFETIKTTSIQKLKTKNQKAKKKPKLQTFKSQN